MTEGDTNYTACVIGSTPHRADEGYLCSNHLQRFADILREIEDETAILSCVPSMQVRSGRGGGLKSTRSPAVIDAIVATDRRRGQVDYTDPWALDDTQSILDTLTYWAMRVRIIRKLAPPTQVTVSGERDVLSRNLAWMCAQDWIEDAYAALSGLLAQLRHTNGTAQPKPIARCYLPSIDGPCGGPIRVDDGYAYCATCRQTWTAEQVPALLEQIHELLRPVADNGRTMLTVTEIVARFGGTENSVRLKLSRRKVPSVGGYYDPASFELTESHIA